MEPRGKTQTTPDKDHSPINWAECREKKFSAPSRGKGVSLDIPLYRTASGQFLRPAASRLLLSRFLLNGTGPSHKAPARLGSSGLSLRGAPGKWGKKKGEKLMSYLYVKWNSFELRIARRRF